MHGPTRQPQSSAGLSAQREIAVGDTSEILAQCDRCAAILRHGRWEWPNGAGNGFAQRTCPACQRIAEDRPAAEVHLHGRFVTQNAVAIESIIHYVEAAGMGRHPMERTIRLTRQPDAMTVSTTATRLAVRIAEAIDAAYNGRINLISTAPDGYLTIEWSR